ncbi:MAG: response regulator [Patescibacteria group bacterium]|nr:response regulator [Patescibacteria group bacterium]
MPHILIIEDDTTLQAVYSNVLKQKGYHVSSVSTGSEGMSILTTQPIDMILLDIMFSGGLNGFDILEQIQRNDKLKNIPVVVLTNLETEKTMAIQCGAVDCFIKSSINISNLLEKIQERLPQ